MTKRAYIKNMVNPNDFVIFHPFAAIVAMTPKSIIIRVKTERSNDSADTFERKERKAKGREERKEREKKEEVSPDNKRNNNN